MAYDANNLSALTYANGFTLWHYKSADSADAVSAAGYFNNAASMLRVGDVIFANVDTADTVESGILVVNQNSGGVVDTADMSSLG